MGNLFGYETKLFVFKQQKTNKNKHILAPGKPFHHSYNDPCSKSEHKKSTQSALVKVVAKNATFLYSMAPLVGIGGVPVVLVFTGTLSVSPLHLFCSQHVTSHFSQVTPGSRLEALQYIARRSWHIDCVKIEIRKKNYSNGRKELFLNIFTE